MQICARVVKVVEVVVGMGKRMLGFYALAAVGMCRKGCIEEMYMWALLYYFSFVCPYS